jgi:hypothetical protein
VRRRTVSVGSAQGGARMSRQRRIRLAWFGAIVVPLLLLASYGVATAAGRGGAAKPAPGGGSASGGSASGSNS